MADALATLDMWKMIIAIGHSCAAKVCQQQQGYSESHLHGSALQLTPIITYMGIAS